MKLRKISILFLLVLGISFIIVSVTPVNVYAGAPPSKKEQQITYFLPTKKHRKTKTPTWVPITPTHTSTVTKTSTATKIPTATHTTVPTKTSTATLVPTLVVPTYTATPVFIPRNSGPAPCCGSGAIVLGGYVFFAVKNWRTGKKEL